MYFRQHHLQHISPALVNPAPASHQEVSAQKEWGYLHDAGHTSMFDVAAEMDTEE